MKGRCVTSPLVLTTQINSGHFMGDLISPRTSALRYFEADSKYHIMCERFNMWL